MMEKRTKQIIIRASSAEHAELLKRAGKMRLATFLRTAALEGVPPQIPEINRDALTELHRVGSNLNQIARHANSSGSDLGDLSDLRQQIAALRLTLVGATE